MAAEKLSIHKAIAPKGPWEGPDPGWTTYEQADPKTGAVLFVEDGWPVAMVQPLAFRPETNWNIDKANVLYNGFPPEAIRTHVPISDISKLTVGSEVEMSLHGLKVSQQLHDEIKAVCNSNGGGYSTNEVRDDMIEANRPVKNATFTGVVQSIVEQNRHVLSIVASRGGAVTIESSASVLNPQSGPPDEKYVQAMVDLLATRFISHDARVLAWLRLVSSEMLGIDKETRIDQIQAQLTDLEYSRRVVNEFCCKAHHIHVREEEPNPNFYAYFLNHITGGVAQIRSINSYSGPFKNGVFPGIHEVKQLQRLLFNTAGYQPAYHPMGSQQANAEISKNIRHGAAASLTRGLITNDKSHGNSRIRTESTLKTAELLMPSAHPIPEVEATQVMCTAIDMAILSHYYQGPNLEGEIPEYAKPFYAQPDERRYHHNRIQSAVHGPNATVLDGLGNRISYQQYIESYVQFITLETQRLGIKTAPGEIEQISSWLLKTAQKPTQWNIQNYLNPHHPDYGVGCLSTHLIAELASELNVEGCRNMSWQSPDHHDLRRSVKPGTYHQQIGTVINKFAQAIHNLYA